MEPKYKFIFCISRSFRLVWKCHPLSIPHVEQIRAVKYVGLKSWCTTETHTRKERSQLLFHIQTGTNNSIMIKANIWECRDFYTGLLHFQIEKTAYRMQALPSDHVGFLQYLNFTGGEFSGDGEALELTRNRGSI